MTIKAMFEEATERWLGRPYVKPEARQDLLAFNLINQLVPGTADIVSAAEHDEIWLSVDPEQLEKAGITQAQVDELVRCGVYYHDDLDSLHMLK
jgi:UPF0288 family protein (methanogenesis marker protein 3)